MDGETLTILGMLFLTALLIGGNALFVFHEFAFVVIKPQHLHRLKERSARLGEFASRASERLDHYIAVDQLGITATSLGVGWVGQPAMTQLLRGPLDFIGAPSQVGASASFIVAFAFINATQMVMGELVPKTVALRQPVRVASLVTLPVEGTAKITHPIVWALNGLGMLTVRLLGFSPQAESHGTALPTEELELIIQASARGGVLEANPDVLRRSLRFSDLEARDVLLPRQDVVMIDTEMTVNEILSISRQHRHTRYPVYKDSVDNVIGLLNVKDLIQVNEDGSSMLVEQWQDLVRPIPILPEYASMEQVLARLSQEKQQMALLLDEYGGVAGILTVTDIASKLIIGSDNIQRVTEGRYLLTGDTHIDEIEDLLERDLVEEDEDFETVGGLIMAELERVPSVGDEIEVGDVTFRVTTMRGHRVMQVVLEVNHREEQTEDIETE
ncbi:MAG: hemolysin family protein [Chloroflexota bacterium]